jgi:hypothetical protein
MNFSEKFSSKPYGEQIDVILKTDESFKQLMAILSDTGDMAYDQSLFEFDSRYSAISKLEEYGKQIKEINDRYEKFKSLVNSIYDL